MSFRQERYRSKRRKARRVQGNLCFWCGGEMLSFIQAHGDQKHPQLCTSEHLIPQSVKEDHSASNVVAACNDCNTARKNHPLEIWLPRVKFRLKQAGNPEHMEVILKRLAECGIQPPTGETP